MNSFYIKKTNLLNVLFSMALFCLCFIAFDNSQFLINWYDIIPLVILLLIYHLIYFRSNRIRIIDFRCIFMLMCYVFFFGITFLFFIESTDYVFWDVTSLFNNEELRKTSFYVLCCLQTGFTGLFWSTEDEVNINKDITLSSLKNISIVLLVLSFPCRLFADIKNVILVTQSGSFLSVTGTNGIIDTLAVLYTPAIIFYCAANKDKKKNVKTILISAIIYFAIIMMISGDRRNQVITILSLIIFYIMIYEKKLEFQKMILYSFGGYFFLGILAALRNIRTSGVGSLGHFFSYLLNKYFSLSHNVLLDTFGEFGLTFFSCTNVIKYVPTEISYQYGLSFFKSMVSILPVGFMSSDFINEGAPSTAINKLNGLSVGDSLIGDCYANFGIWGAIAFGLLMYLIYGLMNRSKVRNKEYRISLYCSLSFIMLNLVRASFFEAVRPTAWLFIVILLFGRFTKAEEV